MSEKEGGSQDRASRLRERRSQASERAQQSQAAEQDEPSKPSETEESDEPSESSVKDEQVGTYMYLPKSQKKRMERVYNLLSAEYEYEYDEEFEKNRHFFPLTIQYGLESLDGLDAQEIRDRLENL